ncbi:MAG: hypothetical protein MUP55_03325 [Candidatus Aenigmarchaeota archaeon]|nr:hypothetical protein [Candidatus Aenigmarchaeota archaeon]
MILAKGKEFKIDIDGLTWFEESIIGSEQCSCSLCHEPIDELPLLLWDSDKEIRLHQACFERRLLWKKKSQPSLIRCQR